jgi:multiple sugar transport system substrate-binding protein
MQRKSRRAGHLFSALLAAAVAAGCRPTSSLPTAPEAPHHGVHLHVACPGEATADLLRRHGGPWALRQGAQLGVVRYDPETGPEAGGPADVWVLAPADLPRLAAAGRLAPVPEGLTARDNPYAWNDLLPIYRERLIVWSRTPVALPLAGESLLCCYRADYFQDAAHRAAFRKKYGRDLEPPATWRQFAEVAEYFRDRGPSLPPLPADDAALDRLFYTVAAGFARRAVPADEPGGAGDRDEIFSFHYDLKTGEPRIAAPGFVYALGVLKRLEACRPPGADQRPEEAFRDGKAVLCLADAPWLKAFQGAEALRDRVGVCRVPGGDRYFDFMTGAARPVAEANRVPYFGGAGWLAAVPADAPHAAAAFDLLAALSEPKESTQIFLGAKAAGGPIRAGQLSRERWDAFDLDEGRSLRLKEVLQETLLHRGLKNPAVCLRTPRQAAHRAVLLKEVRAVLLGGADPAEALKKVAGQWSELDRRQGLDAHRADYRLSLGLLAQ